MGFLSKLFRGGETDDEPEELEEEEEQEEGHTPPKGFPSLYRGMPLIVDLSNGKNLLKGNLASHTFTDLSVERAPGQLSFQTCDAGTAVYIRGFNTDGKPFDLQGTIQESSRIICRIKDLSVVVHDEKRDNFRLPLSIAVQMFYQDDTHFQNPENCMLVNISSGGACVMSEYIHAVGEILRLKVQIDEYAPMTFLSEIVRVEEPNPGKFRYGLLFAQLTPQESTALTKMLFNAQVGRKKMHSRSQSTGAW